MAEVSDKLKKIYWIQGAIKKHGSLRKYFKVKAGETIPESMLTEKLSDLKKAGKGGSVLARRIMLALKLKKFNKGG